MRVVSFAWPKFLFSPRITYLGGKMQRVLRFTLLSLAAAASLTACGDKVELQNPATPVPDTTVSAVVVTPSTLSLAVAPATGAAPTGTLTASVTAGAGRSATGRTVTWSSSNTAVATVAAASATNPNTAVVTAGKTAGQATISAVVNGSPSVVGSALVTVGAGGGPNTPIVFNIANVAQNLEPGSAIANLSNIFRQIDVTFNVDGTGTNAPAKIDLIARCANVGSPADSARIVATQVIAATGSAAADAAEEAAVPITLSFNTAQLDSTANLNPRFLNGNCTISGRLTTVGGTIVNSTNVVPLVLNNTSYFSATYSYTKTTDRGGANPQISPLDGLAYNQGDLKVVLRAINYASKTPIVAVSGRLTGEVFTDSTSAAQSSFDRTFTCTASANAVCTAGTNQTFNLTFPATQGGCPTTGTNPTTAFCINQWTSTSPLLTPAQDGTQIIIAASSDQAGNEGFTGPTGGVNNFVGLNNSALIAPTLATAISPPQTTARTRFDNTSPVLFSHVAGDTTNYRASFNPSAIRDTLQSTNFAAFPKSPGLGTQWISGNVVASAAVPGGTITNTLPFTFTDGLSTSSSAVYRRGLTPVSALGGNLTGSDDRFQTTTVEFRFQLDSTATTTAAPAVPGLASSSSNVGRKGTSVKASTTANDGCSTAGWSAPVTTATGIPQNPIYPPAVTVPITRNTYYSLRVFEWDALGNIRCTDLPNRFGVDNQVPNPLGELGPLVGRNLTANPRDPTGATIIDSLTFSYVDSLSGFVNDRELFGRVYRNFTPSALNCAIGSGSGCNNIVITRLPIVGGVASGPVPSQHSATSGNIGSTTFNLRNGSTTEAYYTAVVRSADQAGNLSLPETRTFLYDLTPPTVGGIGFSASLPGGTPGPVFTSQASDNVDLYGVGIRFGYPATNGQPAIFVGDTAAYYGPNYDETRITTPPPFNYSMGGQGGFIKQIWQQAPLDSAPPAGTTGANTQVQNVYVRAVDAARNGSAATTAAIPAGNVTVSPLVDKCPAAPAAPAPGTNCYYKFTVTEPGAPVAVSNGSASVTLAASVTGSVSVSTSPFSTVCFYYEQTGFASTNYLSNPNTFPGIEAGDWVRIGCQALGEVTDAGLIRTWTYRLPWNPDNALGTTDNIRIRAFGFSAANPGVVHATQPNANITLAP